MPTTPATSRLLTDSWPPTRRSPRFRRERDWRRGGSAEQRDDTSSSLTSRGRTFVLSQHLHRQLGEGRRFGGDPDRHRGHRRPNVHRRDLGSVPAGTDATRGHKQGRPARDGDGSRRFAADPDDQPPAGPGEASGGPDREASRTREARRLNRNSPEPRTAAHKKGAGTNWHLPHASLST